MTEPALSATTQEISSQEMVGLFATRDAIEGAIKALRGAGFDRSMLSVLSSHDSIDAAGKPGKPWKDVLSALVGELKFEGPLVASGVIYLAGGPVAGAVAALLGAAVGGMAVKEVLDEVTSAPDSADFERALEAGSVILWVRVGLREGDAPQAADILSAHGASNVHLHG